MIVIVTFKRKFKRLGRGALPGLVAVYEQDLLKTSKSSLTLGPDCLWKRSFKLSKSQLELKSKGSEASKIHAPMSPHVCHLILIFRLFNKISFLILKEKILCGS